MRRRPIHLTFCFRFDWGRFAFSAAFRYRECKLIRSGQMGLPLQYLDFFGWRCLCFRLCQSREVTLNIFLGISLGGLRAHNSQRQRTSSRKDERDGRFLLDTSGNCIVFCWDCNSATYADVRPPTVVHLIVAGSPEGWNHRSYQCVVFLTQSVCVPVSMDRYRLFSFPCPGVKRFRKFLD